MAELEVTKEAYDQLLEKLKFWKEEQRRLLKQLAQEARHASDSPSHEALRFQAQLEELTSRIIQLDARLQSVRIIDERKAER